MQNSNLELEFAMSGQSRWDAIRSHHSQSPFSPENGATDSRVSVDERVDLRRLQERPVAMSLSHRRQRGCYLVSSVGGSSWSMSARIDSNSGVAVGGGCFDGTSKSSNTSCSWATAEVKKRLSGPNSRLWVM